MYSAVNRIEDGNDRLFSSAASAVLRDAFGIRVFVSSVYPQLRYVSSERTLYCPSMDTREEVAQAALAVLDSKSLDASSPWLSSWLSGLESLIEEAKEVLGDVRQES